MSTTDYTYRLDTSTGAATPSNTVGGAHTITGGSPTLVSLGGGKNYWRFDGSTAASAAVPSRTTAVGMGAGTGGGVTIAFRFRVITYPAVNAFMFGYCEDTTGAAGPQLRNSAGSSGSNLCYNSSSSLAAAGSYVCGVGALQTIVMRVTGNDTTRSTTDYLDIWKETVGRSGSTPDRSNASGATASNYVLDTLAFASGMDIYVEQFVIYAGEKTDVECAALADDIYTALTVAADLNGSATLDVFGASGTMAASGSSDLSGSGTVDVFAASGTMGMAPGTLTTPVLKNNTGTILASVSGIVANIYNSTTGALVVRVTGLSSNSSGIVTITDALLVPSTTYAYELDLSATTQGRRLPTGVAA